MDYFTLTSSAIGARNSFPYSIIVYTWCLELLAQSSDARTVIYRAELGQIGDVTINVGLSYHIPLQHILDIHRIHCLLIV